MGAGHHHGHGHSHDHGGRGANRRRLAWTLAIISGYMVAEVVGGLLSGSLALLADAGHMLSDAAALALALFALWIATRPATSTRTYGYYRTEILAALANGATLVAIAIYIFVEAYHRLGEPPEVQGGLMMGVALGGLGVNLIGLWILHGGRDESLNMRGAWLHLIADAMGSVGALIAGALIWMWGLNWADPVASVLIGLLVLASSWSLLKESVAVLMEGAPAHIDVDEVRNAIRSVDGVEAVHDLHVWTITSGMVALSAHVVTGPNPPQALLGAVRKAVHDQFGIDHTTIQIEPEDFGDCGHGNCEGGEEHRPELQSSHARG